MFNVIYQEEDGRRKRLDFEGDQCAIGGGRNNDFRIKNRFVCKEHASIYIDGFGDCIIEDKESKAGTWVNKERVSGKKSINDNDEVTIGNVKIWVCVDTVKVKKQAPISLSNEMEAPTAIKAPEKLSDDISLDKPILPASEPKVNNESLLHWGNVIHSKLIDQMDLRRKDVHSMSDDKLRSETELLIDEIIHVIRAEIPEEINLNFLKSNVLNDAVGLGPLEQFLKDDSITEIMVNNYAEIFVERDGKLVQSEQSFSGHHAVLSVIERIITPLGRRIDESSPMVDARLKDGSRVNAIIPPLALKGPSITIRKFSKKKLEFQDLVTFNSVSQEMVDFLQICVKSRKNIIVSGGTGSGKTTLLNVLSNFIPDSERIITVEDAAELKLSQPNLISLESKPANVEGKGQVGIRELVKNTLRMRPDRIVVGECRGGEALDMLQAMNTGHDGSLTTAHANSPRDVLSRLEVMVLMAGMDLPIAAIREQVSSAIDVIVQQTRFPCGSRKITRVTEVVGIESGTIQLQDIFEFNQIGFGEDGKVKGEFRSLGFVPSFYEGLRNIGVELDLSIFKERKKESEIDRY